MMDSTKLPGTKTGMKAYLPALVSVVLCIASSYHFLDREIARSSYDFIRGKRILSAYSSNIPDLLLPLAVAITGLSWAGYCRFRRKDSSSPYTRFFHLIGWTVPLSFLFKTGLKYVFGMTNARVWLANKGEFGFHWLHGGADYCGFPSGHMAVFSVLIIALARFFPPLRFAGLTFLLLLAAALIVTGYHFLSDVVAGALLGLLIANRVFQALEGRNSKQA
jgi:membrane-associated phospholipid phosphatase